MDDVLNQELVYDKTRELRFETAKLFSAYRAFPESEDVFYEHHRLAHHYAEDARMLLEAAEDTIERLETINEVLNAGHGNHFDAMYQASRLEEIGEIELESLYVGPLLEALDEYSDIETEILNYHASLQDAPGKRSRPE